jgi:HEAT repeat protein/beta-lactamase regulating signal transducer with metallopeptidase domain
MTSSTLAVLVAVGWKSFAVMGAALIVARLLKGASAATRHLIWTTALAGVLLLPVLSLLVPQRPLAVPSRLASGWLPRPAQAAPSSDVRAAGPGAATTTAVAVRGGDESADILSNREPASTARPDRTVWIALWLAGALVVVARIVFGYLLVRRSARRAHPITSGPWRRLLRRLASLLGLGTPPALLRLPNTAMPMTWGVVRPAVLLPAGADDWPEARREVVLLHELAHVRRRDCLTQALAQLACALYWFNPIVWMAARHLRAERELACDDVVLQHGAAGSTYAAELLELARTLRDVRGGALATVAMARRSQLEGRLLAILNPAQNRATLSRPLSTALATALFLVLVPIAAVMPVSGAVVLDPEQTPGPVTEWPMAQPSRPAQPPSAEPDASPAPTAHSDPAPAPQISDSTVDALVAALDDPDAEVRRTAAHALARLRDRRALPGLTAALKDESPDVRRAAAGALGDLRDQQAVDGLIGALKDPEPDVRRAAASALGDLRDPRAVEPLIAALGDEAADVRRAAASALGDLRDPRAVAPLLTTLQDDNPDVRRFAASALGDLRDASAVPGLIGRLKDADTDVRRFAASALGDLRDRRAVPALVTALSDENAEVRRFAASALGDIRDPAAAGPLVNAMKDTDPEVRRAAIAALADVAKGNDGFHPDPNPNPGPQRAPGGGTGAGVGAGVGTSLAAGDAIGRSAVSMSGGILGGILDGIVGGIAGGISSGIDEGINEGIVSGVAGGIPAGVRGGVTGGTAGGIAGGVQGGVSTSDAGATADVRVTQRYLVPVELDGRPVEKNARRWALTLREHSLAFTMRNEPRGITPNADPGVAVVTFTPEAGHRYEVEIRGPSGSYATRVWTKGEWKPVVRDRTIDRIVSSDPTWRESGVSPAADADGVLRAHVEARIAKNSSVAVRREEKIG